MSGASNTPDVPTPRIVPVLGKGRNIDQRDRSDRKAEGRREAERRRRAQDKQRRLESEAVAKATRDASSSVETTEEAAEVSVQIGLEASKLADLITSCAAGRTGRRSDWLKDAAEVIVPGVWRRMNRLDEMMKESASCGAPGAEVLQAAQQVRQEALGFLLQVTEWMQDEPEVQEVSRSAETRDVARPRRAAQRRDRYRQAESRGIQSLVSKNRRPRLSTGRRKKKRNRSLRGESHHCVKLLPETRVVRSMLVGWLAGTIGSDCVPVIDTG